MILASLVWQYKILFNHQSQSIWCTKNSVFRPNHSDIVTVSFRTFEKTVTKATFHMNHHSTVYTSVGWKKTFATCFNFEFTIRLHWTLSFLGFLSALFKYRSIHDLKLLCKANSNILSNAANLLNFKKNGLFSLKFQIWMFYEINQKLNKCMGRMQSYIENCKYIDVTIWKRSRQSVN